MNLTGRVSILAVFVGLVLSLSAWSAVEDRTPTDISGTWEGAIRIPGSELGISIEFVRTEDGTSSGTIDIPAQGAKDLPLAGIELDGAAITFDLPGIPGTPQFSGNLSVDRQTIAGDFSQGGAVFPFDLKRKDAADIQAEARQLDETLDNLRAFIDTTMETWHVPGLAVSIVRDGKVIMSEGFGLRDIKDSLPVTENSLFAIGSATKAFTTMAMAMLVYDGLLDWDEPVRTYLPTFELHDAFASERMTPRDLTTHRSGLPRHDAMWYNSPFTRLELFDRLQYLQPNEDFRTRFQYQNLMYMTAGYLVGQVTGSTWEDAVRERIFEPLGMTGSNFSVEESQVSPDFALPYNEDDDKMEEMPFRNITTMGPAGSINSSAADMAKWVQLHLNGGKVGERQLISEAAVAEMHTPQMVISRPVEFTERLNASYGLGWFVETYRGHNRVYHGGNIDGFSALISLLPQDDLGMVVLTNLNGTPLPGIVSHYATDLLLSLEPVDFHGRIKTRVDAAKAAFDDEDEEKLGRCEDTKPSHKLQEYAGEYEHPGYGVLKVEMDGKKKLKATFNNMPATMQHWHYDVFRAEFEETDDQKIMFQFLTNAEGDIDRVSAPLEISVDEIVFKRKPSAEMFSPEFLAQFVGEYDLAGQVLRFEIKGGNTLVAIIPGQPVYDLQPYKDTEFQLKGYAGISVKFTVDDKEGVTEAIFKQPNGVFTAKRKN